LSELFVGREKEGAELIILGTVVTYILNWWK